VESQDPLPAEKYTRGLLMSELRDVRCGDSAGLWTTGQRPNRRDVGNFLATDGGLRCGTARLIHSFPLLFHFLRKEEGSEEGAAHLRTGVPQETIKLGKADRVSPSNYTICYPDRCADLNQMGSSPTVRRLDA